jgi:hypothetical protein
LPTWFAGENGRPNRVGACHADGLVDNATSVLEWAGGSLAVLA